MEKLFWVFDIRNWNVFVSVFSSEVVKKMSYSIRQLLPGDVLDFPILPEWEDGTAAELDEVLTRSGRGMAILKNSEVIGALWCRPDSEKNLQCISAWKYRPTKELCVFARELIAFWAAANPDRIIYTISKPGKASDRWHEFIGLKEKIELNPQQNQYSTEA